MSDTTGASSAPQPPGASRTLIGTSAFTVYVWLALLMIGMVIVGFWENYFGPLVSGTLDAHWTIHVHTVVFSAWMLLFLGQALLASRGHMRRHQTVGKSVGIVWGGLLAVVGFFLAFAILVPGVGSDKEAGSYAPSLLSHLGSLFAFVVFFAGGMLYRKRPAIHKRLMVLATVALVGAPMARLFPFIASYVSGFTVFLVFVMLRLTPAFAAMAYDRWTRGKVHPVCWGGLGMMALVLSRFFWSETGAWLAVGNWLIEMMHPVVEAVL
jgi:hypothetical protein